MTGKKELSAADAFILLTNLRRVGASFVDPKSLDRAKQRFDLGDKSALLDALYAWIFQDPTNAMPLPEWVRLEFVIAFTKVRLSHEYRSWDEAFGPPLKKNEKHAAKRAEALKRPRVWARVAELRRETPHRDVFPEVAKEFGISVAEAKKYFYAASKLYPGDTTTILRELEQLAAAWNKLSTNSPK